MVIKVDLACEKCRRKIKKVLCGIPQIQNQVYDEKINTVTVTVYCCCPEKIMKKICCKGGKTVKAIEIKAPEKLKEPQKKDDKKREPKKDEPEGRDRPRNPPIEGIGTSQPNSSSQSNSPNQPKKSKEPEKPKPPPVQVQCVPGYPPPGHPNVCFRECYEGYGWGPFYEGYGRPVPCYEGCGRPVYDGCGGGYGRGCYESRCDYYLSEENPRGCIIM